VAPTQAQPSAQPAASQEAELVARLRAGDERAFEALVDRHYAMMLAVARGYVRTRAVAEEVVQEAWLGVLKGIDRFEGRPSLKTWIMRIVVNIAMSRGEREARSIPFSAVASEPDEPAVDPEGRRDEGDRGAARGAAGRDHHARRRRLQRRGGLRGARRLGRQPARASAPCAFPLGRGQGRPDGRVPELEGLVIAYKFLRPDGTSVFTGFSWPGAESLPGPWVEAEVHPCRSGIHACRPEHLPLWAGDVLWELELEGDVVEDGMKLIAPRARLTRRIEAWDEAVRERYTRMCADRAHELAHEASPPLEQWEAAIEPSVREGPALLGFMAARIAEAISGPEAYHAERARQTGWLVEQLRLGS
jgi:RNA polymerase sigma factor (sigma-70 family)